MKLIGWFCLKDKFLEQEIDTTVLRLKDHGKFGVKLNWSFQFNLPKMVKFFELGRKLKFEISLVGFF